MKKTIVKKVIIAVIIVIILILAFLIYKNLFALSNATRNADISDYKITNNEKNSVKDKIKEIEEVNSVDIHTNNNSKIIKIVVKLKNDVDLERIKEIAKESISNFSEKNLSYYDIEFFVDSNTEDSTTYPIIGSKYRANSEFSW